MASIVETNAAATPVESPSSKIAEAEELAEEALRMAGEAKRAAQRLAEVKAKLSRFSMKYDDAVKVVVVEAQAAIEDYATPFEADKAAKEAVAAPVVEEKPVVKEKPVVEKKPIVEEAAPVPIVEKPTPAPPAPIEQKKEVVVSTPAAPVHKKKKVILVTKQVEAPKALPKPTTKDIVLVEDDNDIFVKLLDSMGLDKACGVDDVTIMKAIAEREGIPYTPPVASRQKAKKEAPVVKKEGPVKEKATSPIVKAKKEKAPVIKKEAPVAPKITAKKEKAVPTTTVYHLPQETLLHEDEIEKDLVEKFFDYTVGKACGVDDVTLGLARPTLLPPPPAEEPSPFVNPTKVTDIMESKSYEQQMVVVKKQVTKYPPKVYQTAPTNQDFTDPFGIDHDSFVTCGNIADICEPDVFELEQPYYMATIKSDRMVATPSPEQKKPVVEESQPTFEEEAVVEEAVVDEEESKEAEKAAAAQCDPEGEKKDDDDLYADDESDEKLVVEALTKDPIPSTHEEEKKEEYDDEITAINELQRRELERRMREQEELLRQVDDHIWCV